MPPSIDVYSDAEKLRSIFRKKYRIFHDFFFNPTFWSWTRFAGISAIKSVI